MSTTRTVRRTSGGTPRRRLAGGAALLLAATLLAGCASNEPSGDDGPDTTANDGTDDRHVVYDQAGSSTVLPIARAWAEEFHLVHRNVDLVVGGGGSGSGIAAFCRGELDVADASRAMKESEAADCRAKGIEPVEWQVAIDGLAVVVSTDNDFVDALTVEQLNMIWTDNATKQVSRWNELDPSWPDEEIELYGPGTNSGTFDYFIEVIIHPFDGKETKGRSDYTPSEDDNVLVQGVRSSQYALGYFGLYYAVENQASIRAVPIDEGEGDGPVAPTPGAVSSGAYSPLSRPLFMYTDGMPTGALADYFEYAFSADGQGIVEEVGYIRLHEDKRAEMLAALRGG